MAIGEFIPIPAKRHIRRLLQAFSLRLEFVNYSLPGAGAAVYQLSHDEKIHRLLQSEH